MKITILTDNFAGAGFLSEHGLSYFIEVDDKKILLDAGSSDVFLQNATKLHVNLDDAIVVLSHGHWDHGNGLQYLNNNNRLITHSNSFIKRYRKSNNEYLGLNLSFNELAEKFKITTTKEPFYISKNIIFLGEIERIFDFENWQTSYKQADGKDDFISDDSALAIIENNKLNIVTGCSHSGICNIIEYAKKITGLTEINLVIGGFHLKKAENRTLKTIEYFKANNVAKIYPSHCTQLPALSKFYDAFNIEQVKTGIILNL
ncbi:MAG: MBL fold metallo-hydrolase [Bacteroidales bacterium]|nr:MBL fold metallo-hydrolase [Bacteroidales bacterium]